MVTMKTSIRPWTLDGRRIDGVRRIGKMLAIEAGDLTRLVSPDVGRRGCSCGTASVAAPTALRAARPPDGDRELRLREFGTQQRAWGKLAQRRCRGRRRCVATLGPMLCLRRRRTSSRACRSAPHLHPLLRDQRVIAASGAPGDELLWTARLSPSRRIGPDEDAIEACAWPAKGARRRIDH